MRKLLSRHRPSPAMCVALIALMVAMGGTGYAAIRLPRNSVGASQIKASAVRSSEVRNGALLARDFRAGQLPQGEKGEKGDKGDKGDAGAFDPTTTKLTVQRTDFTLPAGPSPGNPGAEVDGFTGCPAGEKIIGGSVNTSSPAGATTLISRPATDNVGNGGIPDDGDEFSFWKGTARTETNAAATMRVFAHCASKPPTP